MLKNGSTGFRNRSAAALVREKNLSSRGQGDVRSGAVKELNTEILLQRLDLETHCGLREIQIFSGLAEAEPFRDCAEDHKTEIF